MSTGILGYSEISNADLDKTIYEYQQTEELMYGISMVTGYLKFIQILVQQHSITESLSGSHL